MAVNLKLLLSVLPFSCALLFFQAAAIAQVTPANDGTGTRVNRNGDRFDIDGGSRSSDGHNLFHSFEDFGLDANQIANFLSNPETRNILGRVVGGDASVIDGLIRLSGGDANLYLINPAGVIFGSNARLDVPGSFTATTANGIGFGNTWFSAFGDNDYAALVGDPSAFAFTMTDPGSIINAGELAVSSGEVLTLLGGTVINTGTLAAPGGQITVAAVPGENLVRISQEDALLSLELEAIAPNTADLPVQPIPFTPLDIPALLSGGHASHASDVVVNPDGTVRLTSTDTPIPTDPGTTIVSGQIDTSHSSIQPLTSEINVLGDRIGLLNATLSANSPTSGGTIRIGGDYQGQGTVFNASRTFVDSQSSISADAVESGNGGRIIIWANEATGFYGDISARGGESTGDGGFVEVSGRQDLIFRGDVDVSATNGMVGSLLLDPENIIIVDGDGGANDAELADNEILAGDTPGATFTISETTLEGLAANADVTLVATNDITINDLEDNNLNLPTAPSSSITFTALGGDFSMNPGDTITTQGGNLTISGNTVTLGGVDMILGGNLSLRGNEIDLIGGDESIQTRDSLASECCFIAISPPFGSNQDIILGGTAENPNSLDLTQNDLNAFSRSPLNSAIYRIGTNGNLTIPDNPADPLRFNRNLFLDAGLTLTIERELEVPGPIVLRGSEIDLLGGENSIRSVNFAGDTRFSRIQLYSQTEQDIRIGAVDGTPASETPALDLTLNDLAALEPEGNSITIGNLAGLPGSQIGDITVLPGMVDLPFNENIRFIIFETNAGTVQIQHEMTIDHLVVTAADVELDALVTTAETASFQPSDPNSSIGIGDEAVGDFNLSTVELTDNLNSLGSVSIGSGSVPFSGSPSPGTGRVELRNLEALNGETYDLTVSGGDIHFEDGSDPILQLADDRTARFLSTGFIDQGPGRDVVIGGDGTVLFDAVNGINEFDPGSAGGQLDVYVRNIAARTESGDILLGDSTDFPTDYVITAMQRRRNTPDEMITGLRTETDGTIQLASRGSITVDQPITANNSEGSGNIQLIALNTITLNQSITTNGSGNISVLEADVTNLNSTVTSDSGEILFSTPVNVNSSNVGVATASGNITFENPVSGDQILSIDAGSGTVQFDGTIGSTTEPLLGLDIDAGEVDIQARTVLGAEGLTVDALGEVAIANNIQTLNGGQIEISSGQNITIAGIRTEGGAIALISENGDITATGFLQTTSEANNRDAGNGGDVLLRASDGNITTDSIFTQSLVVGDGDSGNSGDIEISASGDVSTGSLRTNSSVTGNGNAGNGGTISVDAGGTLTIEGQVNSRSQVISPVAGDRAGNGGDISFTAGGDISIDGRIISLSRASAANDGSAGSVTVTSDADIELRSGSTSATPQAINADAPEQRGSVLIDAAGDITLIGEDNRPQNRANSIVARDVTFRAGQDLSIDLLVETASIRANRVTVDAGGTIDLIRAPIQSFGQVSLTAGQNIVSGAIDTEGGAIALSTNDTITLTGDITTNGGNVRILDANSLDLGDSNLSTSGGRFLYRSANDIQILGTGQLATAGGDLRLRGSSIDVASAIALDTSLETGRAGDFILRAEQGEVRIGDINSSGQRGGAVDIRAATRVRTGNINASGSQRGGEVTLEGDRVITGDMTTTGEQAGGDIEVNAVIAIATGNITTSSSIGDGGDVFLDPRRDIEVGFIDARGGADGTGGEVFIFTERFFRATETFGNNVSISTAGGISGGDITIIHDGGSRGIPFNVGNLDENGTAGAITSGEFAIAPPQSFPGSVTVGNIEILTTDFPSPPPPTVPNDFEVDPATAPDNAPEFDDPAGPPVISGPSVVDPGVDEFEGRLTPPYVDYTEEINEIARNEVLVEGQEGRSPLPNSDSAPRETQNVEPPTAPGGDLLPEAPEVPAVTPTEPETPSPESPDSETPSPEIPPDPSTNPDEPAASDGSTPSSPINGSPSPSPDTPLPGSGSDEMTLSEAQAYLRQLEQQTGIKPALVYGLFAPESGELELLLVTARDEVIRLPVLGTQRDEVIAMAQSFREELTLPLNVQSNQYVGLQAQYAQQFYQWLVAPLLAELQEREIDNIAFLLDEGLRSLPIAALHDGEQFLIEQYSIGLMPSLSLTDMTYVNINNAEVLAMGASEFSGGEDPLPATEVETDLIANSLWNGEDFMNEDFTLDNLLRQRRDTPFGIVHLATHANFFLDRPDEAYIQLWDTQLRLSQIRELSWHNPAVELVVLSACRTALGDRNTELGFAGFSTLAGVKSTLASLWSVDDVGTLGLMVEFYQRMQEAPIKAEALRQAQLAMLNGEVYIENQQFVWSGGSIPLPDDLGLPATANLSHPYFWSGFTMIGSPW